MKNIILITIDCLRPDHLNCYGYRWLTSPYMSKLAEGGMLFTKMYANSSYTCASVASLITSTYPFDFNEYFEFSTPAIMSKKRTLLSQVLKRYGYTNAFFHDNPYLSSIFGYNRGFETSIDLGGLKIGRTLSRARETMIAKNKRVRRLLSRMNKLLLLYRRWYRKNTALNTNAETTLKTASKCVEQLEEPYFIWCHLMDTHIPYSPKHEALHLIGASKLRTFLLIYKQWGLNVGLTKDELDLFKSLYDLQIFQTDEALARYMPKLTKDNMDDSFIIITADHGEEFMENGKVSHKNPPLSDNLLHVPLIIHGGGVKGKVVDAKSSLLDLAPTILDLLGFKRFSGFKGRSLLQLRTGRPVVAQGIISGKRYERIF